jgi:hypothetical protein
MSGRACAAKAANAIPRANAETSGKAIEELRRERYFRHEDQGLPLAPDIFRNCSK